MYHPSYTVVYQTSDCILFLQFPICKTFAGSHNYDGGGHRTFDGGGHRTYDGGGNYNLCGGGNHAYCLYPEADGMPHPLAPGFWL